MPSTFGVIDLFAGPGGLGEGFASLIEEGRSPFGIGISIEKEASAHRTLTLRAFLRSFHLTQQKLPKQFVDFHSGWTGEPDWSDVEEQAWLIATHEARCLELGTGVASEAIEDSTVGLRKNFDDTVLIGGPPCQAYSLVGRARAKGKIDYVPEDDPRHYLFREYIRVLDRLRPAAFVMENVKGMLSSTIESRLVFEMLMEDLSSVGKGHGHVYELLAIHVENGIATLVRPQKPSDFIVKAEEFGVPQRRHRVIIIGIRSDLAQGALKARINVPKEMKTVQQVIGNLPCLRSGLSQEIDAPETWQNHVLDATDLLANSQGIDDDLVRAFLELAQLSPEDLPSERRSTQLPANYGKQDDDLSRWIERPILRSIAQHETRGHMSTDLGRYMFAAIFGDVRGYSPKAKDFPTALSPNHRNWHSGVFADRFRVQIGIEPSSTITSHISKDGHYFIHPDPLQCRSLTVREAARLQTFPDDYLFLGNRTEQYVQVGNAVPPFLATAIAKLLWTALTNPHGSHT
ncbi:DNA cytosine methyltransferase [Rhizobium tumorigenes]|uniref:DNA cytosine methyltransferase n=1 Tax=Rhizobium tumorigenes TaxID=2041385 RepID=UPI00241F026C|nr:DNA cytosine methyltransferase [Rhizobium tumorigenes]WFR99578.1 DNA cytosine methyltransferase [Rhizobium tumorigenes]